MNLQSSVSSKPPIGVFDSGVGGLSVLDKLVTAFPQERFVYFGDTLNMPYGQKSYDAIAALAHGSIRWLTEVHGAKLVVIACNTSAVILQGEQRPETAVPLVGTMVPVCDWLADASDFKRVGLIATPFTVKSHAYQTLLQARNPQIEMLEVACPELAALVEQGRADAPETRQRLGEYLAPFADWQPEALILGCTHYPFARSVVRELLPKSVQLLDPADHIAERVAACLDVSPAATYGLAAPVEYYVSAAPERFVETVSRLPLQNLSVSLPTVVEVNPPVAPPRIESPL